MQNERLQKVLAQAGLGSRRACETLITDGRVRVNGKIVKELGTKVNHHDRIDFDGKRVVVQKLAYYMVHKPRGVVSTLKDPQGRPTLADLLSTLPERVFPVGRLDFHTSGALLCTNDGLMGEALLRPASHVPKVYVAKIQGHIEDKALEAFRNGVVLEDGYRTKPANMFVLREEDRNTWVQITLREGKNRQIHRMADALGYQVMRLARTSIADISTDGLRPGDYRPLTDKEIDQLKKQYLNPWKRKKAHRAEVERDEVASFAIEWE